MDTEPVHPLEKLKQKAEGRAEKANKERVHCPDCGTTVWKDTIEDAVEAAENHDQSRHDGSRTTKVNGMLLPSDDVVEAAENAVSSIRQGASDEAI